MELIDDLNVARGLVNQAYGTPENLDEMLTVLTRLIGTFDPIVARLAQNVQSQYSRGNAQGIRVVLSQLAALVSNTLDRQGQLMAEHAAYAAAGDYVAAPARCVVCCNRFVLHEGDTCQVCAPTPETDDGNED